MARLRVVENLNEHVTRVNGDQNEQLRLRVSVSKRPVPVDFDVQFVSSLSWTKKTT